MKTGQYEDWSIWRLVNMKTGQYEDISFNLRLQTCCFFCK